MSFGNYIRIYIFNLNVDFDYISQEAPDIITNTEWNSIYEPTDGNPTKIPSFNDLPQFYVNKYESFSSGNIYTLNESDYELYNQTLFQLVNSAYGIEEEQQYFFEYVHTNPGPNFRNRPFCHSATWQEQFNGNSSKNYVSVKSAFGNENINSVYLVSVEPEYIELNINNLTPLQFTFTRIVNIGNFEPGTYDMYLYDITGSILLHTLPSYTLSESSSVLNIPNDFTFPILYDVYIVRLDVLLSNDERVVYTYVSNHINITLPDGVISPSTVNVDVTNNFTVTPANPGSVYPPGEYVFTFTDIDNNIITKNVTLSESSEFFVINIDSVLFNVADINYNVEALYKFTYDSVEKCVEFSVTPDVSVECFMRGTKILCFDEYDQLEKYVNIENIKKGMLVKTYHQDHHKYTPVKYNVTKTIYNKCNLPNELYKLYVYKKDDYPELIDELVLTGGHPILTSELSIKQISSQQKYWGDIPMIYDKFRLLTAINEKAYVYCGKGYYQLYDLILESMDGDENFGIYANGILTESMSINYFTMRSSMKIIKDNDYTENNISDFHQSM